MLHQLTTDAAARARLTAQLERKLAKKTDSNRRLKAAAEELLAKKDRYLELAHGAEAKFLKLRKRYYLAKSALESAIASSQAAKAELATATATIASLKTQNAALKRSLNDALAKVADATSRARADPSQTEATMAKALDDYESLVMWLLKERSRLYKALPDGPDTLPPLPVKLEDITTLNRELTGSSKLPTSDDLLPGAKSMRELAALRRASTATDDHPLIEPPVALDYVNDDCALYLVPSKPSAAPIVRVLAHASSLNTTDVFVLVDSDGSVFQYNGPASSIKARGRALDFTRSLRVDVTLVPVSDPSTPDYITFMRTLLPDAKRAYTSRSPPPSIPSRAPAFVDWKSFVYTPVACCVVVSSSSELELTAIELPLTRALLTPSAVILIDTGSTGLVFVWIGSDVAPLLRKTAISCAEHLLREGNPSASSTVDRPSWAAVVKITPGTEPYLFTQHFADWETGSLSTLRPRDPDAAKIARGEKASDCVASVTPRSINVAADMYNARPAAADALGPSAATTKAQAVAALNLDPDQVPGMLSVMIMEDDAYPFALPEPAASDGHFFDADAVIVIYYYESLPKGLVDVAPAASLSVGKGCVVFFWMGMYAPRKLWLSFKHSPVWATLSDSGLNPVLLQVDQGAEPPALRSLFRGFITVHHGHASAALPFAHRAPLLEERPDLRFATPAMDPSARLFRLSGFNEYNVAVHQVAASAASLTSADTFLLYDPCMQSESSIEGVPPTPGPGTGGAFLWSGRGATDAEHAVAVSLLDRLSDLFNPTPDAASRQPWFELIEGSEDPDGLSLFCSYLSPRLDPGDLDYARDVASSTDKRHLRLFAFSLGKGYLTVAPSDMAPPAMLDQVINTIDAYLDASPYDRPSSLERTILFATPLPPPAFESPLAGISPQWRVAALDDETLFHVRFPVWWGLKLPANALASSSMLSRSGSLPPNAAPSATPPAQAAAPTRPPGQARTSSPIPIHVSTAA
ncbi:uncharacterized protein AMSG_02650 [Thecamonas trahens ATCC 50062]|uniref:Gelsolin-like domain-containing protein n=1 Tax=Thecamonas trahens ATCC 50062 TaxID=461836 RepID=A0A0L0D8L4_THETB|nr:hypothetical protein AMSG_02650 [Thecamonas trahens ATCC 50062]KNC47628.1 hypothetical protein AMSG_02650 [Thecamonas trahens ATCC 50062]|eukprot:XP_013759548.1 hypothetical protein AMSG_02650 [Thecamonas trahens ATCC 50062]